VRKNYPDLVPLSSGNFGKRQASQKAVNDWVISNHEVAKEVLLKKYLQTDNPELRVRLIPLLERSYFKPKGYVGIIMSPELKDPNAKPPGTGACKPENIMEFLLQRFSQRLPLN
jgi:hypothetical protein